jgi:hypothetical protein
VDNKVLKVRFVNRTPGELPLGAFVALPLMLLPLGAWLVESQNMIIAQCSFKMLLGIPCMGCGATRATLNLMHGHFLEALYFQPLAIVAYLSLAVWGVASIVLYAVGKDIELHTAKWLTWTGRILLILAPFANWGYMVLMGI